MQSFQKVQLSLFFLLITGFIGNIYPQYRSDLAMENPFDIALGSLAEPAHLETVESLIASGIEIDAQDENLKTLMHHAVENENLELLDRLLNAHGNINIQDRHGNTPLHTALLKGSQHAAQKIISFVSAHQEAHLDCSLRNRQGLTLSDCAKKYQHFFNFKTRLYKKDGLRHVEFSLSGKPPYTVYYEDESDRHAKLFSIDIHGVKTWVFPHEGMLYCVINKYKKLREWNGLAFADPFPVIQIINFLKQQAKHEKAQAHEFSRHELSVEIAEDFDALPQLDHAGSSCATPFTSPLSSTATGSPIGQP